MPVDIIIIALIAAFIALRLRSELGRTDDEDEGPQNHQNFRGRFDPSNSQGNDNNSGNNNTPIGHAGHVLRDVNANEPEPQSSANDMDPTILQALQSIGRADRSFNPDQFVSGARNAYPMILEAFWGGDIDTLKTFLSDEVFGQFSGAVEAREADKLTVGNRFVDLLDAKIVAASLNNRIAEISIEFSAEIVAVTKDYAGRIIEGDPSDVVPVHDVWTFARDVKSRDMNWDLVGTRTAE